ncbi:hypothetical protein IDZ93_00230 [Pseudomonas aeruginosa]|uniref:hypothetical protein n=1 Tax=Pseudomonas aeruginosa TaxID=287 RepID=UPI001ADC17FB|nr:hypothetical protein [Pseudomonas aeruginosa]MBO8311432.1 hypothetical protein [Pseudomonas aeruginosa]
MIDPADKQTQALPWSSRSAGAVGQPPAKPCPMQSGRGATGRTRKRDDQPSRKDNEDGKKRCTENSDPAS